MRILFMGTPDFALFSLRALCEAGEEVIGVVTQPDKPKGRGYTLTPPPVKVYAVEQGIPVYQPSTLKGAEFEALLALLSPDVIVVVAYGKILPKNVLDYPAFGCVNVHGSLLPAYRGAAPMQRAIIDGKKETGITTMKMDVGLDTGDMLLTVRVPIGEDDDFETIHDRLGEAGASLLLDTLSALKKGTVKPQKQDETLATYAAKIEKADCLIDFDKDALEVHNRIRGLSPVPLAFTYTSDQKMLKIAKSRMGQRSGACGRPGEVVSLAGGTIEVACKSGTVKLLEVLPEGKRRMNASDFINGRRIATGDVLSLPAGKDA